MSKTVHWTVPFASIKGVQYRVDIYADGACEEPTQLVAGAEPFTTDEDDDDDYFKAVRSQTGNLTVVDMDGTLLETLIPKDNVDRPVRLVRVSDSKVMWQGFLSCEAYSQDYTAREQELTMNVNSVLEAMESIKVSQADIQAVLHAGSKILTTKAIMDLLVSKVAPYHTITYNYTSTLYNLFREGCPYGVNPYMLFKEDSSEDDLGKTTVYVEDITMGDLVEALMESFGLCLHENGEKLYIVHRGANASLYGKSTDNVDQSDLEWRGTGHTKDVRQGAKKVSVSADMDEFDEIISLPNCPIDDLYRSQYYSLPDKKVVVKGDFNKMDDGYNTITLRRYSARMKKDGINGNIEYIGQSTAVGAVDMYCWNNITVVPYMTGDKTVSDYAFFASALQCEFSTGPENGSNGLYLAGFVLKSASQFDFTVDDVYDEVWENGPIFSIKSMKRHYFHDGYLELKVASKSIGRKKNDNGTYGVFTETTGTNMYIMLSIRVGDKYYQGLDEDVKWGSERKILYGYFADGKLCEYLNKDDTSYMHDGWMAYIDGSLEGDVEVMIWPFMVDRNMAIVPGFEIMEDADRVTRQVFELEFSSLSVSYSREPGKDNVTYSKETGASFGDDVEINPKYVSAYKTTMGKNNLLGTSGESIQKVAYQKGSTAEENRPEKDLLERMDAWYKKPRRVIGLETAITDRAVPEWIMYDRPNNKYYTPFAESKDWRMDTSTVKLFER